jgi:hypothetical protein
MNINEIINIVLVVLGIIITLLTYYFKIKAKLESSVSGSINDAEIAGVDGKEKMKRVVDDLYSLVPLPYKMIFTKDFIEKLVQKAFDKIEEYAKKQTKKIESKK